MSQRRSIIRENGVPILGAVDTETIPVQQMVILFDPNNNQIGMPRNDFDTFQALAALEAVKAMILHDWLKQSE